MPNEVVYQMSLKDMISQGLIKAEGHAKKLETSLHGVNHVASHMMGAMGMYIAFEKTVDFVEKSLHAFHELHEQESLLENTLAQVGERAHITSGEMVEFAEQLHEKIPQTISDIIGMEGALARYNITNKETFERIINLSGDIAVAMKRDGKEVASHLGLIMEKPALATRRLREFGIILNSTQQQTLAHLVRTGHVAEAQNIIFDQLAKRGFAGAGAAAAAADPLFKLHRSLESIKLAVGEGATAIMKRLAPAFNWLAGAIRDSIAWMKEHKDLMGAIATVIGTVAGAVLAIAAATKIWTAVTWLLNTALLANPITWIVIGIVALVAAVVYCYNHFAKFRAIVLGLWETLKAWAMFIIMVPMKVMYELGQAAMNIFHPGKMLAHLAAAKDAVKNGAYDLATSFKKGYDEGMASFAKDQAEDKKKEGLIPKAGKMKGMAGFDNLTPKEKNQTSGAKGQKNIKIDIKIGALVSGGMTFNTTNLHESAAKIKEHISNALMSVVNDSQLVAGQ